MNADHLPLPDSMSHLSKREKRKLARRIRKGKDVVIVRKLDAEEQAAATARAEKELRNL